MAGSIKGIIVEIGGDTSGLQKALKKVNSSTSSLSKELRGVNSLLKLDPKNTELVSQKQTILKQNIEQTSKKLEELRKAQEMADNTIANGGEISQENYRNLQREIINTESKLKQLQVEASKWTTAGRSIEEFGNKVSNISNKLDKMGTTLTTRLTLPVLAVATGLVSSAKEFETAFTGVEKTVDGTATQMASLKQGIKDMAEEIPASTTEIAAVAEAAGQLGIQTDNVLGFTKTMINMGNATNLSADEAATTLARFANVTKMSQSDFDKLGSVIVALGNNFATTEAEISAMGMNLASAGTQVGMSQSQIMALATALSSVGLEAQAGGTAFSKVMVNMQLAVEKGGKDLKDFASVAGMSTKQFQKAFKEDATSAIMKFVEGLSKSGERGKSAIKILDDMGITETRLRDALLRSANASSVMSNAIEVGNKAWEENTALTNEADKRYQTLDSRLQMTKNKIVNVATNTGDKLTPSLNKLLDKVDGLIDKFDGLIEEEITNIIKTAALVAAIGPAIKIVGTLGKTVGTGVKTIGTFSQAIALMGKTSTDAFKKASSGTQSLAKGLTVLTSPIGLVTLAITGATLAATALYSETNKNNEAIAKSTKELENNKNKYNELVRIQDEKMSKTLSEADNTKKLSDELKTLVDENGKVRDGYKDRVSFILNELNQALGTETKVTDGVIDKYKELESQIDQLILKKKAIAILENDEAKYNEARDNRTKSYDDMISKEGELANAKQKLLDKEKEYTDFKDSYWGKVNINHTNVLKNQIETEKLAVKTAEQNLNDSKSIYKDCLNDIATYENDFAIVQSGNNEKIQEMIDRRSYTYKRSSDDIGETINHNIQQVQYEVQQYQLAREEDLRNNDTMNAIKNQTQIDAGKQQILNLATQLKEMTSTTEELTPQQKEAWKNMAIGSYDIYSEVVSGMDEPLRKKIQDMTGVIVVGTPEMQEKSRELGEKTVQEFDKSAEAKTKALNTITGYLNGLSDENKRELLKQAGIENVDAVIQELDKGNLSEQNGKNILEGLWRGLSNGTWKGKILGVASGLAQSVNKAFTGKDGWDEHSPSKKMKKFAEYYIQPISDVMENRKRGIVSTAQELANKVNSAFNNQMNIPKVQDFGKFQGSLSKQISNNTRTTNNTNSITVQFYPQKMSDAEMERAFNYVDRRYGQYMP